MRKLVTLLEMLPITCLFELDELAALLFELAALLFELVALLFELALLVCICRAANR